MMTTKVTIAAMIFNLFCTLGILDIVVGILGIGKTTLHLLGLHAGLLTVQFVPLFQYDDYFILFWQLEA